MPDAPIVFMTLVVLGAFRRILDWITETSAPESTRNVTLTPCTLRIKLGGVLECHSKNNLLDEHEYIWGRFSTY